MFEMRGSSYPSNESRSEQKEAPFSPEWEIPILSGKRHLIRHRASVRERTATNKPLEAGEFAISVHLNAGSDFDR